MLPHWEMAAISIHSQDKTPCHNSLSPKRSRMWAMQKEIKDVYPKKVGHMLKHVKKKMHTQRRYAACSQGMLIKKRRKRKIAHI
jgi:hypothetical protein